MLSYKSLSYYIQILSTTLFSLTAHALSVGRIRTGGGRNFWLPLISVGQQLLLVVEQLLTCRGGVLSVGTLNNSIDGARLLAETAVDALGHIDIVASGPPAAVHTLLSLDSDSLRRADGFTELAGNAALLASRVPPQGVLTAEAGRNGTLLEGVENGVWRPEKLLQRHIHAAEHLHEQEVLAGPVQRGL